MDSGRVALDTNVLWHGMLPSNDPIAPVCRELLRAVDDGKLEAYVSTLSMVELPKVVRPQLQIEKLVALTEELRSSRIVWVPLDEAIALKSRELGLERNLAPAYDAVVLATAVHVGAEALYTYDRDDFPVGKTIDGVHVQSPALPPHLAQQHLSLE